MSSIVLSTLLLVSSITLLQREATSDRPVNYLPEPASPLARKKLAMADELGQKATKELKAGSFIAAEKLLRQALLLRREALGNSHPRTAEYLSDLANFVSSQGKFAEAELLNREALAIRTRSLGESHFETAKSYFNLAYDLSDQAKYTEAVKMGRRSLALHQQHLGEDHVQTAQCRSNLANDLSKCAEFTEAESLHRLALVTFQKHLGDEHPHTAVAWNNLSVVLSCRGKLVEAEATLQKALAIRRKVHGDAHPSTAKAMNNLAVCLNDQGKYIEAENVLERAFKVLNQTLGESHIETTNVLFNLANARGRQGKLAEAEALARLTLSHRCKQLGDEHWQTAQSLGNLASRLASQGKLMEAETLDRRALEIYRKTLGPEHLDTAFMSANLAATLVRRGRHSDAEPLFKEALAIRRKTLGEEHSDTVQCITNLAICAAHQGRAPEAESLFRHAYTTQRTHLGETHPETSRSLFFLGDHLRRQRKFESSEQHLVQAWTQLRDELGEWHPITARTVRSLINVHFEQQRYAEAERWTEKLASTYASLRQHVSFTGLDRVAYDADESPYDLLAILRAKKGRANEAWDALEQYLGRGLLDDLAGQSARTLRAEERQAEQSLQVKLTQLERLSERHLAQKVPDPVISRKLRTEREELLNQWTQLQARLQKEHGIAAGASYPLQRIQRSLQMDQAFITWLDYQPTLAPGEHWAVFVRPQGDPLWVKVPGSGTEGAWTQTDQDAASLVRSKLITVDPNVDLGPILKRLAKLRFDCLSNHLEGIRHLVVLPSESLAGVPLEVLTDRYRISYAPSGSVFAWLRERRQEQEPAPDRMLALGDPVFQEGAKQQPGADLLQVMRGLSPRALPCTRNEVEAIAKLLERRGGQAQTLLGKSASRRGLDSIDTSGFRYLHLATHGHANASAGLYSYLSLTPEDAETLAEDKLSAAEIFRTWKLNADLVTLSACSSGLGQHRRGEGYLGFAQALFYAGARSLVLSQWQVSDYATSLFMVRFYQNLLGQRVGLNRPMSKLEALEEARTWMRTLKHDDAARLVRELPNGAREIARWEDEEYPYSHPNYWSAFILIGDPGA